MWIHAESGLNAQEWANIAPNLGWKVAPGTTTKAVCEGDVVYKEYQAIWDSCGNRDNTCNWWRVDCHEKLYNLVANCNHLLNKCDQNIARAGTAAMSVKSFQDLYLIPYATAVDQLGFFVEANPQDQPDGAFCKPKFTAKYTCAGAQPPQASPIAKIQLRSQPCNPGNDDFSNCGYYPWEYWVDAWKLFVGHLGRLQDELEQQSKNLTLENQAAMGGAQVLQSILKKEMPDGYLNQGKGVQAMYTTPAMLGIVGGTGVTYGPGAPGRQQDTTVTAPEPKKEGLSMTTALLALGGVAAVALLVLKK